VLMRRRTTYRADWTTTCALRTAGCERTSVHSRTQSMTEPRSESKPLQVCDLAGSFGGHELMRFVVDSRLPTRRGSDRPARLGQREGYHPTSRGGSSRVRMMTRARGSGSPSGRRLARSSSGMIERRPRAPNGPRWIISLWRTEVTEDRVCGVGFQGPAARILL
jgi:hypothetical protein